MSIEAVGRPLFKVMLVKFPVVLQYLLVGSVYVSDQRQNKYKYLYLFWSPPTKRPYKYCQGGGAGVPGAPAADHVPSDLAILPS
jgi:hypothetical protein